MSSLERRQYFRVPCQAFVEVSEPPGQRFVECEARDVSAGGMCIRFSRELQLRSRVRIRVWQAEGRPIECDGTVNWTLGRGDIDSVSRSTYDIGIEFDGISERMEDMVKELMGVLGRSGTMHPRSTQDVGAFDRSPLTVRGDQYVPELTLQPSTGYYQLLIQRGDTPYYSQRFTTVEEAQARWDAFKASMLRRADVPGQGT